MYIIGIDRTFYPRTSDYTFFSSEHIRFSRIDHVLGHKSSFNKFKKIENIPSIFSDHMLWYKKSTKKNINKPTNMWRLRNTLLKNDGSKRNKKWAEKIETNENDNTTYLNFWNAVKAVIGRKFISLQAYLKIQEKSQVNNLTLHLKELGKEGQKQLSQQKKVINKN